jgi:hypothetical protein
MKYNHIISLGSDCLPRVACTNYKMKKSKKEGELSCPFDLSVTSFNDLILAISSDFNGFVSKDNLYNKEIGGVEIISNSLYVGTHFNHESPFLTKVNFVENEFKLLIERYENRIDNFKKYIEDNNILFVFHAKDHVDVKMLKDCITVKYPDLKFELVIIQLYECLSIINTDIPGVHFLKFFLKDIWNVDDVQTDFASQLVGRFIEDIAKGNSFPI